MDRDFLKKIINDEVLTLSEVADFLNISKQAVSNLVSRGQISPVKTSASGHLFLKMDIEAFKYTRRGEKFGFAANHIIPQTVYGHCTADFEKYFEQLVPDASKVLAVFMYFYEEDAIKDGFYTTKSIAKKDTLMEINVPTFVVKMDDLSEIYFRGALCGYCGQGPGAAFDALTKHLKVPKVLAEELFYSRYIKYFKDGNEWKYINQYRDNETKDDGLGNYEIKIGSKPYLFNNNLVIIRRNLTKNWIGDNAVEFIQQNFWHAQNPISVTIYSREMALRTGHYISTTVDTTIFQVIIKDESGREVWLDAYVNEKIPLNHQENIKSILDATDIMFETESPLNYPEFVKHFLNRKIHVQNYLTFGKKAIERGE